MDQQSQQTQGPQEHREGSESVARYLTCTAYRVLTYQRPSARVEWPLLVAFTHDRGGIGLSGVALARVHMLSVVETTMLDGLFGAVQRHVMTIPFGQGPRGLAELSRFDAKADPTLNGQSYFTWGPIIPCHANLQGFFEGTQAAILGAVMHEALDVRSVEGGA